MSLFAETFMTLFAGTFLGTFTRRFDYNVHSNVLYDSAMNQKGLMGPHGVNHADHDVTCFVAIIISL